MACKNESDFIKHYMSNGEKTSLIAITPEKALQLLHDESLIAVFMVNEAEDLLFFRKNTPQLVIKYILDPGVRELVLRYFYLVYRQ